MIFNNKKGIGLEWYAIIIGFFFGLVAFSIGYATLHKVMANYIGQHQFAIMKASNEAEKALFYVTQSAKYSLQQSIYELAQNGGSAPIFNAGEIAANHPFVENECGKFSGAYIWYELKKDSSGNYVKSKCFEETSLNANLIRTFGKNLNQHAVNYDRALINNYNYELKGKLEITGKAVSPLKFEILKDKT